MKAVIQLTKMGIIIEIYKSIAEAAKLNGLRSNHLSEACNQKQYRKTVGGYRWEFLERESL